MDLENADLRGAFLDGASLRDASLHGTDLQAVTERRHVAHHDALAAGQAGADNHQVADMLADCDRRALQPLTVDVSWLVLSDAERKIPRPSFAVTVVPVILTVRTAPPVT